MSNGPTIIYDKSAIQRLNAKEADWFTHFFRGVITPIYMIEVIGDLAKENKKRDPKEMVATLAAKTQGLGSVPTVDHTQLIDAEILGNPVEMRGVPIMDGGVRVKDSTGKVGVVFDESPEERALHRWKVGEFQDEEHSNAAAYRQMAKGIDLQEFVRAYKTIRKKGVAPIATTLIELLAAVDALLNNPTSQFRTLTTALDMFDQPDKSCKHVKSHWIAYGRPMIRDFLPYTHFCMRVGLLFSFGVGLQLIGERATNAVDLQYLFYLPFCQVFVSADNLHKDLVPLFLKDSQVFVESDVMQGAMRQLVEYYAQHEDELKERGTMGFARYPPLDFHTAIHDIYDKLMPGWRRYAAEPEKPITPEENARLMADMRPMIEAMDRALEIARGKAGAQ